MSYLDMRPVPLRDFVVEFESLRSSSAAEFGSNEVGQEFEPRGLMRRSQFYSSPLLPHVWFEPVITRCSLTVQEFSERGELFRSLERGRHLDAIMLTIIVIVLIVFLSFFVLLLTGIIPYCNIHN